MYSAFNSFSLMGMSNSDFLLSHKDLNSTEFNCLSRPMLEFQDGCQISPSDKEEKQELQHLQEGKENEDKYEILVSSLEIKLPCLGEFNDDNDGIRTPTSLDHKIPLICPPAPRKPKPIPLKKRKASHQRILLDFSREIESMFPPALLRDLGGKIKKARKENGSN